MRFREDGADIPDSLIEATTAGDAVFLCGAGVSMRERLPNFEKLTQEVYNVLRETWANEPAEQRAWNRGEYDRVLRSLEKRIHRPGTPPRVREVVRDLLGIADGVVIAVDHLALLQLSRDTDGRPRLLTTNFDTYFERAAHGAGLSVPSHAGKAIPKPGGLRDHGILHIHGRCGDRFLNLEETDFTLTSADFGDAYLRDGWASQYIEDRMRLNTLVLVGYAAEDPALRLLLETLDADRDRFRDLKDIYAIDVQTPESSSLWKAKGIKPIEFTKHDNIYSTIQEWARFAAYPEEWRRERVRAILAVTAASGAAR